MGGGEEGRGIPLEGILIAFLNVSDKVKYAYFHS